METSVEQLIKDKTFASLTNEELLLVQELCETEEEFLSMKQFFLEMEGIAIVQKTIINPEIKTSLDAIFGSKHPGIRAAWSAPEVAVASESPKIIPLHQRTWFRVAAVAVLVAGTIPFWNLIVTNETPMAKELTAQKEQPMFDQQSDTEETSTTVPLPTQPYKKVKSSSVVREEAGFRSVSLPDFALAVERMDDSFAWSIPILEEEKVMSSTSFGFMDQPAMVNPGLEADLHPFDGVETRANAISLAEEPEDLLDLLVPAF